MHTQNKLFYYLYLHMHQERSDEGTRELIPIIVFYKVHFVKHIINI